MPIDLIANLVMKFFNFVIRPIFNLFFPEEENGEQNNQTQRDLP